MTNRDYPATVLDEALSGQGEPLQQPPDDFDPPETTNDPKKDDNASGGSYPWPGGEGQKPRPKAQVADVSPV